MIWYLAGLGTVIYVLCGWLVFYVMRCRSRPAPLGRALLAAFIWWFTLWVFGMYALLQEH